MSATPATGNAGTLTAGYADGSLSPVDVATAAIDRAGDAGARLNAIASIDAEVALRAATDSAARWAAGRPLGPLDGVPITFKDSFHILGLPRWHGTAINPGALSGLDAAPVRRAREAGMVVLAKTTMPDYAMLMAGLSSQHGVIGNAWDAETSTSGSSSGAGASVAAGIASVAIGTDMVGSVRLPAAVSGLASIKPTQGRIAYDPAGDYRSAGPMARTVDDVESALEVLGQYDPVDQNALPGRYQRGQSPAWDLGGTTVGVLRGLSFGGPVDEPTAAAVEAQAVVLAGLGATVVEIDDLAATADDYQAIYWFMLDKGLPDYLARDAADRGRIQPSIGRMLDSAVNRSAADAAQGMHRIAVATERIRRQLSAFDYVLSPVLPVHAWPAEQLSPEPTDPMSHMGFACWFNRLTWPAGTVPVLSLGPDACPVSVQIAGQRFDDAGVLQVLRMLEAARGFEISYPGDQT